MEVGGGGGSEADLRTVSFGELEKERGKKDPSLYRLLQTSS